jgi:diguanylate cyclase (GGDEF)-like protein
MTENLRREHNRSANSPIQLDDLLQSEMDLGHFRVVMKESFQAWKGRIEQPSFLKDGALFVCDPQGVYVDGLIYNKDLASHQVDFGLQDGASWSISSIGSNAVGRCIQTGTSILVEPLAHEKSGYQNFYSHAVPILNRNNEVLAVIGCLTAIDHNQQDVRCFLDHMGVAFYACLHLNFERIANRNLSTYHLRIEKESKKRDILFQIAKKLHSKIDVDSVLSEVMDNMKDIYPAVEIDLYLSQDNHSLNLPVKSLMFQHPESNICTRAFMEGHIISEKEAEDSELEVSIAAPLSGKQGVYGVLHFKSKDRESFDETDIKFITMIADSAGTAFENAKLYEQSNILINELRLINEITQRLNQSLKLNEIFHFASNELIKIFNADFGCILQLDTEHEQMVVQSSNLPEMANEIFSMDYGFSGKVISSKEPIIISDYWANPKVNSKLMDVTKARSLIASPIMISSEVMGVIMVVHEKPNFFSYDNYKLLQVLSGHIGLAMANASLHAEVRRMVITDNLTGLFARHYLDEQVNYLQKKDFCGALIVADIDHFKSVNDTHGHQIGDKILIQVSRIIQTSIRDSDIAARWGGEELAIYLPQATLEQTMRVAERVRIRVADETDPGVTVSCGVAEWTWEDEKISVESLFYKADMALYEAKHDGRNRIKIGK